MRQRGRGWLPKSRGAAGVGVARWRPVGRLAGTGNVLENAGGAGGVSTESPLRPGGEVGQGLVQSASGRQLGAGCWSKTIGRRQIGQTDYGGEGARGLGEPATGG